MQDSDSRNTLTCSCSGEVGGQRGPSFRLLLAFSLVSTLAFCQFPFTFLPSPHQVLSLLSSFQILAGEVP